GGRAGGGRGGRGGAGADPPGTRAASSPIDKCTSQPIAAQIHALEAQLAALRQQQRAELIQEIVTAFPPGEVFSAGQVWQQPALRAACVDAGLTSPPALGKFL